MFTDRGPAPHLRTTVLLSGGMDSATVLALALENSLQTDALVFRYGQPHCREVEAAYEIVAHYNEDRNVLNRINAQQRAVWPYGQELRIAEQIPGLLPRSWVAGRNLLFLVHAAMTNTHPIIAIGAHQEDQPGYPDCTAEFFEAAERTLSIACARPIQIWAPLLNMDKTLIAALGTRLNVPYELTWSCYKGGEVPCGECDACIRRTEAFKNNGRTDPWEPKKSPKQNSTGS